MLRGWRLPSSRWPDGPARPQAVASSAATAASRASVASPPARSRAARTQAISRARARRTRARPAGVTATTHPRPSPRPAPARPARLPPSPAPPGSSSAARRPRVGPGVAIWLTGAGSRRWLHREVLSCGRYSRMIRPHARSLLGLLAAPLFIVQCAPTCAPPPPGPPAVAALAAAPIPVRPGFVKGVDFGFLAENGGLYTRWDPVQGPDHVPDRHDACRRRPTRRRRSTPPSPPPRRPAATRSSTSGRRQRHAGTGRRRGHRLSSPGRSATSAPAAAPRTPTSS